MRTIEITEGVPFSSFPNGSDERHWKKGDTDTVSNDHAKLLVETKGLARYIDEFEAKPAALPRPAGALEKKEAP